MPTRYLVLRTDYPIWKTNDNAIASEWNEQRLYGGPADMHIEIVDGREKDAGELRADPCNAAVVAADILLSLIEPKESPAGAVDDGLETVGGVKMPRGLTAVGAHTSPFTGQGITVAVLDTGIDEKHPAFAGKTIIKNNFTSDGDNDDHGHGTHCAGTICGAVANGVRVGVAPGVAKLCAGKVIGRGGGTLEMLMNGMYWAVFDENASVVSMSLGFDIPGNAARLVAKGVKPELAMTVAMRQQSDMIKGLAAMRQLLEWKSKNVVFVAASGNESARPAFVMDAGIPASELLAVGAVGPAGVDGKWKVADFSNGRVQLVAPGVGVLSAAVGGGWTVKNGTSMAAPHIAGLAALYAEKARDESSLAIPDTVISMLRSSASRRSLVDTDPSAVGAGMAQAPQS